MLYVPFPLCGWLQNLSASCPVCFVTRTWGNVSWYSSEQETISFVKTVVTYRVNANDFSKIFWWVHIYEWCFFFTFYALYAGKFLLGVLYVHLPLSPSPSSQGLSGRNGLGPKSMIWCLWSRFQQMNKINYGNIQCIYCTLQLEVITNFFCWLSSSINVQKVQMNVQAVRQRLSVTNTSKTSISWIGNAHMIKPEQ